MSVEFEIVEVLMERRRAGQRLDVGTRNRYASDTPDLWDIEWDAENECELLTDWHGLSVCFTGTSLAFTYAEIGMDTFEGWIPELLALGDALLDAEAERRAGAFSWNPADREPPTVTRFLTLWRVETAQSRAGEYRHAYSLLGVLDPSRLEHALWREKRPIIAHSDKTTQESAAT